MTELYIISLDGATDVRGVESLASYGGEVTPVSKTFLGDNESLGLTDAGTTPARSGTRSTTGGSRSS